MEHLEQLRHSGLFESRVPRYTSYPPVSRFAPAEGKLHQAKWLNTIPHGASLSVYVHIPYCEKMCWFCVCRTQAADNEQVINDYVKVLQQEIALVRAQLPDSIALSRLHLGGGTPTLLSPHAIRTLLHAIFASFPKTDDFECAVEIDSMQLTDAVSTTLIEQGMTRAIVGVQDFEPNVQKAIGRRQTFEQTLNVVRTLRDAGLQSLDMELLYGLPMQSATSIAETTQQVLALEPDRLAVCEYSHTPTVAKRQNMIDTHALPAAEDSFLMSQVARQILLSDGYEAVGMDHFVRPKDSLIACRQSGSLRRDFQGYSDNKAHATLGFGASAISRFPQGYVQNSSATSVYCKNIKARQLAGNRGYGLTGTDLAIAHMIEMLMCRFEIDIVDVVGKFPGSARVVEKAIKTIGAGFGPFVEITPDILRIKQRAHPLARIMSEILDEIGIAESSV